MRAASLNQWLVHLETLHPRSIDLGLDRVRAVQCALGLDDVLHKTVLVAGTNGKGSTSTIIADLLQRLGRSTGLYTSPHLLHYSERIRVNGAVFSDAEICNAFFAVDKARGEITLTYFEFGTLAAALLFQQQQVEYAVLEVGLGGRLDAVNIFDPALSVITSIDFDHQDWLGEDLDAIGIEKAGIMRTGVPCMVGESALRDSVIGRARELSVPLVRLGQELNVTTCKEAANWSLETPVSNYHGLPLSRFITHAQRSNAALAIASTESLMGQALPQDVVTDSLSTLRILGRQYSVFDEIETIFDVAHNPGAARALAEYLDAYQGRPGIVVLFGIYADKDIAGFVSELGDRVVAWHLYPMAGKRAASTDEVADILSARIEVPTIAVHKELNAAIAAARADALKTDSKLLVTGSFEVVAAILASRIYSEAATDSG